MAGDLDDSSDGKNGFNRHRSLQEIKLWMSQNSDDIASDVESLGNQMPPSDDETVSLPPPVAEREVRASFTEGINKIWKNRRKSMLTQREANQCMEMPPSDPGTCVHYAEKPHDVSKDLFKNLEPREDIDRTQLMSENANGSGTIYDLEHHSTKSSPLSLLKNEDFSSISDVLQNAKSFSLTRSRGKAFAAEANRLKYLRHRQTFDSYDYQIVDSMAWHDREKKVGAAYWGYCGMMKSAGPEHMLRKNLGRDARVAIILLGICVALGGVAVIESSDRLFEWKVDYVLEMPETLGGNEAWRFGQAFLVNVVLSCAFAFVAFLFVVWLPASQGSGIAEIKSILNGVHLSKITSLETGFAKCTGVVFAVAGGLPVGIEGPMIHLGLVLGTFVSQVRKVFHSDRHRRDFAACGTAAGVAAAFRTPIGGVLFALEEGASFWSTLLTWRAFSCAIVTVLTVYFIYGVGYKTIPVTVFHVIGDVSNIYPPIYSLWQVMLFAFIGLVGGLLGALWIFLNTALSKYRRKLTFWPRLAEMMSIAIVMATLMWWTSYYVGTCIETPVDDPSYFYTKIIQFNCEDGEYNDLASIFFNTMTSSMEGLFHTEHASFSWQSVAIAGWIYYFMSIVTFGSWTSCGIFMPALLIGACLGRTIGEYFEYGAQAYAIIGAGAILGGITRVLISISVILANGIGFNYMLVPLMLVFLMARTVGNMCGEGIYEVMIENRHVPFLEEEIPEVGLKMGLTANQIMSTDPICFPPIVRVAGVRKVLEEVSFNGFPVINPKTKCIIGLILRKHLEVLLYNKHWVMPSPFNPKIPVDNVPMPWEQLEEFYPNAPPEEEDLGLTLLLQEADMLIDLTPYYQIAPHTFHRDGSAERAYELFRSLGLRHLPIVDDLGHCMGIVTRANLSKESLQKAYSK